MSIRLKLVLFISFLFLTAIGNALLTFQLEEYLEAKLAWVSHTNEVLLESQALLGHIKDAETGQRGFLLTQDNSYLEPYHTGVKAANEDLSNLERLTTDNPEQQERLEEIKNNMDLKFDELRTTIELAEPDHAKALQVVRKNHGKKYMDELRILLEHFDSAELVLLEQRKGDFRENRGMITTLVITEIMFFIFLAFLTVSFLNRNLFLPMSILLKSTKMMEENQKVEIADITPNDEMGYLISSFMVMQEKVFQRTKSLDHKAHHDELTGLQNRSNVYTKIDNAVKDSQELGAKTGVFFIDLNKFKPLNDTLGHDVGDAVLVETAKRLTHSLRDKDQVFRIGGDEFLVLIVGVSTTDALENIAANILNVFKPSFSFQGHSIDISLSIGIAIAPDHADQSNELVKLADVAMYSAKVDQEKNYAFFTQQMLKRSSDNKP